MNRKTYKEQLSSEIRLFASTKVLCVAALLAALSFVIGTVCKAYFTFGSIRITFENLPILITGIFFGPFVGALVGALSDLISCFMAGYAPNPVIFAGAVSVGLFSGLISHYVIRRRGTVQIFASVYIAHIIGSLLLKSAGLYLMGYALPALLPRIPLYIAIAGIEAYIIYVLSKNKSFSGMMEKMKK